MKDLEVVDQSKVTRKQKRTQVKTLNQKLQSLQSKKSFFELSNGWTGYLHYERTVLHQRFLVITPEVGSIVIIFDKTNYNLVILSNISADNIIGRIATESNLDDCLVQLKQHYGKATSPISEQENQILQQLIECHKQLNAL